MTEKMSIEEFTEIIMANIDELDKLGEEMEEARKEVIEELKLRDKRREIEKNSLEGKARQVKNGRE